MDDAWAVANKSTGPVYSEQTYICCTRWIRVILWRGCKTGKHERPRRQRFAPWWTIGIGKTILYFVELLGMLTSTFICKLAKHSPSYSLPWIGSNTIDSYNIHNRYACTQDPIHYHGKNRKKCHILSHLCDKKHHPLRVSWCWPHIRTDSWRPRVVLLGSPTTPMQDSNSSWLLQHCPASQRTSKASSILQRAKQLSTTTFPQVKSNESMGPSPVSKKPLRDMGIQLLLRAVPSTTLSRMHTSQMSMCHRFSTATTTARSSTKTMCQRGSMVKSVSGLLWKKENNQMYISGNKKHTVKARDKTVDLKKTKDLYGRLMVLARSNRGIEKKQAVACLGEYGHRQCGPARTAGWKAQTPRHHMQILAKRLY